MSMLEVLVAQQQQALAELRREQPHSIELTRNAKGEYGYQIKLYFASISEPPIEALETIDKALKERFIP